MNIIVITSVSMPIGMASTQRILRISEILSEFHNVKIFVTSVNPVEIPTVFGSKGKYKNIHYEYLTGTNKRSNIFLIRRIVHVWGKLNTIFRMVLLKALGQADVIYLYGEQRNFVLSDMILVLFTKFLRIPLVKELCEKTWNEKEDRSLFERVVSPLWAVDGVICISEYLNTWARDEASKLGKKIASIQIPMLVLDSEWNDIAGKLDYCGHSSNYVLFAGAPEYKTTIRFLLDAMDYVWEKYPEEKLVITGFDLSTRRAQWLRELLATPNFKNVRIPGFLARETMLSQMKMSDALLLPIFNDKDSVARFPNKLGEYLLSGRPVVACNIGEVGKYLRDGENAFVVFDVTPEHFAQKILEIKSSTEKACLIGENGRELARKHFVAKAYSATLIDFFEKMKNES